MNLLIKKFKDNLSIKMIIENIKKKYSKVLSLTLINKFCLSNYSNKSAIGIPCSL